MDNLPDHFGAHPSEQVPTGAHQFEQDWLSVEQAVVYCAELGLTRTPKTVRKWAERSSGLPDGDVVARKQDTAWGYRWQIERASLTRKVEEELELQAANETEPVRTGCPAAASHEPENTFGYDPNQPEQVPTSSDQFEPNETETIILNELEPSPHQFEPVQSRSEIELVLDEVRERMSDKDREIEFLRQQLADAQTEIGRRARSTDEALKTIDRVVRSFELQAEANRAAVLGAGRVASEDDTQPATFRPSSVDNGNGHQDIRRV
ncbi:MAG: hypothetical protein AAFQ79_09195 [Pseudomonadota bacterium]